MGRSEGRSKPSRSRVGFVFTAPPSRWQGPWAMFRSRSAAKAKEEASSALAPFEVQALFIRTKGAGNTESWPDVLTLRAPSGVASKAPFATRSLKRDKPCCYISTEAFVATDETLFEVCDEDDVWLTCALSPTDKAWKLECRFTEESQKTHQPRQGLLLLPQGDRGGGRQRRQQQHGFRDAGLF